MNSEVLNLRNIHCESCQIAIHTTLGKLSGLAQVVVSAERNEVEVFYDEEIIDVNELVADK